MNGRVLVTGASGFVRGEVAHQFSLAGWAVRATSRVATAAKHTRVEGVVVPEDADEPSWRAAVRGVDVVVHCAARVHVMEERDRDPIAAFRRANVDATLSLARAAASSGARRLVFISSVGVNGNASGSRPFGPKDAAAPHSPYACSKHEAELALRDLSAKSGLEIVVLRPPLVYGPSAPGNFARLLRAVRQGVPLPLGAVNNKRSLVARGNLVDLILRCATRPEAAGQTFMVSDGHDLSTTELLQHMAAALGRSARLLPVPTALLQAAAALTGRRALAQQLLDNLQVDISTTRSLLGWTPPLSVVQAMRDAVAPQKPAGAAP